MADAENTHQSLVNTIRDFHRRGWCEGTGGNFSVVLQNAPLRLLMAPSGIDKATVRPEILIEVDEHGNVTAGNGRASAETALHLTLVKHAQAGSVLHTHSVKATVLSQQFTTKGHINIHHLEMLKGLDGINTHDTEISIPVLHNDQDIERLSLRSRAVLSNAPHALLVAGHGLYTWGATLQDAKRHTEIIEFLLDVTWHQQCLRQNP